MSRRTIVIGDLHGMHDATVKLLDKCKVRPEDHVIFLGDLIDRGPDSGKCVDLVMHREKVQGRTACILGNHESRHIEYHEIEQKKGKVHVDIPTHVATRLQLREEHYDYFKRMPKFIRLPEHNAVCVHAGVFPGRKIEEQSDRHLLHIQMLEELSQPFETGRARFGEKTCWPSRTPSGGHWRFWTHFWDGPERIIFGHSVLDKPLVTDKVVGIDGGAVFGHWLHAVILPGWEIISVPGERDYGKGYRGRPSEEETIRGNRINKYLVHGDVSTYS